MDLNPVLPVRPGRRALRKMALVGLAAGALGSCRDSTSPPVTLDLQGTVTRNGGAMPGTRVILHDRRTSIEPGHILATATTDAAGRYVLRARAQRPGYDAGCEYLTLFIEGYEYFTGPSAPLQCTSNPQTIDLQALSAFDLDASGASPARVAAPPVGVALMSTAVRVERR